MPVSQYSTMSLLTDTEIAEDHVEHVLDIDPAGQAGQRPGGEAKFLGQEIFALGHWPSRRAAQGGAGIFERLPVPGAGDKAGFGAGEELAGIALKGSEQLREARAGGGRKTESIFPFLRSRFTSSR